MNRLFLSTSLLIFTYFLTQPRAAFAIDETNYLHLEEAANINLNFEHVVQNQGILPNPVCIGDIMIGTEFSQSGFEFSLRPSSDTIAVIKNPYPSRHSFAFVNLGESKFFRRTETATGPIRMIFDEPQCAIGLKFSLSYRFPKGAFRSEVKFSFFDASGQLIETEKRMPATGTTFQAYQVSTHETGFLGFSIETNAPDGFAIDDILAVSCAIPIG